MVAQEQRSSAPLNAKGPTLSLAFFNSPSTISNPTRRFPLYLRTALPLIFLCLSAESSAFSLGEVQSVSRLGERLNVHISILPQADLRPEARCIRFSHPVANDGTPWLDSGSLRILRTSPPVLVVTSEKRVVEPILRLALHVGCGHDIHREYTLLLSPPDKDQAMSDYSSSIRSQVETTKREKPSRSRKPASSHDILVLSSDDDPTEQTLRLSRSLASWNSESAASDRQRTLLRMEYTLLRALDAHTLVQLEATARLRSMEKSIETLERQSQEWRGSSLEEKLEPAAPLPRTETPETHLPAHTKEESPLTSDFDEATPENKEDEGRTTLPPASALVQPAGQPWKKAVFFIGLLGLLIVVWLVSRHYRRQNIAASRRPPRKAPQAAAPIPFFDELDDLDQRRTRKTRYPEQLSEHSSAAIPVPAPDDLSLSQLSMSSPTIEEHFEANPVMELAEIMLSFGRVKGAAQALQEFIDSNPEESLQPWIRLMDVYRMAGMRSEFERVAAELNQHFNVEIQLWDELKPPPQPEEGGGEIPAIEPHEWPRQNRKASTLEEAEHIADRLVSLWPGKESAEFLDQLLRSNRGGLRSGFARPVVEEIMFLIELQATLEKMASEKENEQGAECS